MSDGMVQNMSPYMVWIESLLEEKKMEVIVSFKPLGLDSKLDKLH